MSSAQIDGILFSSEQLDSAVLPEASDDAPPWSAAASRYLTCLGQEWISAPVETAEYWPEEFLQIATDFGCAKAEALLLQLQLESAIDGAAFLVEDQLKRVFPTSLQTVVFGSPSSGYAIAFGCLRRIVLEGYSAAFGRSRLHLPEEPSPEKNSDLDAMDGEVRKQREKLIFPYGSIIDRKIIRSLIDECGEMSYTAMGDEYGLHHLAGISGEVRKLVDSFVNSGWSGEAFSARDNHILYPVVNLAWVAPKSATPIAVALSTRLRGLMLADVGIVENKVPAFTGRVCEKWQGYFDGCVVSTKRRFSLRHRAPQLVARLHIKGSAWTRIQEFQYPKFCVPGGLAERFLADAPIQVSKMAALFARAGEVNASHVELADRLYRWLLRGTLAALGANLKVIVSPEEGRVVEKLQHYGPLSLRELTRKFHRPDGAALGGALTNLVARGVVAKGSDKKFAFIGN